MSEQLAVDLGRKVMLWRCPECGSVRSIAGSCHNHFGEPVETEGVWYVPAEEQAA